MGNRTRTCIGPTNLNPDMKLLLHGLHVSNRTDHAAGRVDLVQCVDRLVERTRVERAESLVDKQGLEPLPASGSTLTNNISQT